MHVWCTSVWQKKVQNEVAFAKIFDGTWDELLSIDQLNLERSCNRVFAPFRGINVKYGPGRGKMQHEARLRRLQQSGRALERSLAMWLESPPSFTPTYKYRPGTGKYDLRGTPWDPDSKGGKMRCPAWCDRVLWRAPDGYVACVDDLHVIRALHSHRLSARISEYGLTALLRLSIDMSFNTRMVTAKH